jgi:glycosyltransferase involved in cell wall biosynthesis
MRIAMVVPGGLHPSGREQVVPVFLSLFSRLARHHEVHAFAVRHLREASTYDLLGFTVHDLGRPSAPLGLRRWAQWRALRKAMRACGTFDLVHGFWGDPAGLLAAWAGRHFSIPSIVTCDSGEFVAIPAIGYGSQRTARGRSTIREACRLVSRVHVSTAYMAGLAANHGVNATVIPLGVKTPGAFSARSQNESEPGVFRILQVATLSRVKNQQLVIDAVALLSQRMDVHLDLVGEDTLGGELQASARELGVTERITFHGFVPHDALPPLFANADLYVQTSLHEADGIAVLEAASSGVPIVGTRVGYVADWAPDCAVAISRATPQAFAGAIEGLLRDADRRRALASSAQSWALEHDADWTAAEFERLYQVRLPA